MKRPIQEVAYDIQFVKTHNLQPAWYKAVKVFLLVFFIVGYLLAFGWVKAIVWTIAFLLLSLAVHCIYRSRTERFTRSWLDFKVAEIDGQLKPVRIGKYYYMAVLMNAVLSVLLSQVLA
jgi:hypothetical protein